MRKVQKLIFFPSRRNKILTTQSAEDYQWCYSLRAVTGGSCYTMPALGVEDEFLGYSKDYLPLSSAGKSSIAVSVEADLR